MMKKILKSAGVALGAVVAAAGAFAAYVQIDGVPRYAPPAIPDLHVEATKERLERGRELVTLTCAGCHFDANTGRLTGRRMTDLPPEFGTVFSLNITQHPTRGIGRMSDGELEVLLRTGLKADGQYVPPWMIKAPLWSDEDLHSVVAFLRSNDPMVAASDTPPPGVSKPSFLGKLLVHTVIKPYPLPKAPIATPPRTDKVAYGRYMMNVLDCYSCHSPDFTKVNHQAPPETPGFMTGGNPLRDGQGGIVYSANLTPDDETGIGKWSEADFVRALKKGFRPDGRVLRPPMEPRTALGDDEAAAIYAYLRTIAPVRHEVSRPPPPQAEEAVSVNDPPGKRSYKKYGCGSCHGEAGVGLGGKADLRHANEHFATDAELRAWIDEAPKQRPSTAMPGFQGVIREDDYVPLLAYVRFLASDKKHAAND